MPISKFFLRMLALVSALVAPAFLHGQSLPERLANTLDASPATKRTRVAMYVADAKTGEVIFNRDGGQLFTPASVLKTYTSACALDTFGPDKTFETLLTIRARKDMVVIGGGDAMFTHDDLAKFAQMAKDAGITNVEGDVRVDGSLFAPPIKGPGWMWDDDPDGYNMSVGAMMMDYNVMTASVRWSGGSGQSPTVEFFPAMNHPFEVFTTFESGDKSALEITRAPFSEMFELRGTVSDAAFETTRALTMHYPNTWIAEVLEKDLADLGITVGHDKTFSVHSDEKIIGRLQSKTVSEMITRLNKVSENAIGEMLIHHLSIAGGTNPATWPGGAEFVSNWLKEKPGLDAGDFRIVDGSGLSRYDVVCPAGTVKLLRWMTNHKDFKIYKDSFPIYAATLKDGREVKTIHAKPGGMAAVNTLAGYADREDGTTLVFAIFANGYVDENPVIELRKQLLAELIQ